MKKFITAVAVAAALIGASTGVAEARWHDHHGHGGWHHHRHCTSWGSHHHHSRYCRGWGW